MRQYIAIYYFVCALLPVMARAGIVIDSTVILPSSCQNNGSITIYATDAGGTMLYSIISGPVEQSPQLNNNLTALPSGTYMVKISDQSGNSDSIEQVVGGNYVIPNPRPMVIYPHCRNTMNFQLIGNLDSATGKPPFTWQLVYPSPVLAGPQSSDTFHVTAAGNYAIQCTDACGNIQTRYFTFNDTTGSNISANAYSVNVTPTFVGCDSMREGMNLVVNGDSTHIVFPITITLSNAHGNTTVYTVWDTLYDTTVLTKTTLFYDAYGRLEIAATLPNTGWGDVINMVVTDGCGDAVSSVATMPAKVITNDGWETSVSGSCQVFDEGDFSYFMPRPNNWVFIDNQSNTIIGSGIDTLPDQYVTNGLFSMDSLVPGNTYTAKVYDHCGDTIAGIFVVPPYIHTNPACSVALTGVSCLDSTASAVFIISGFNSSPVLAILSGPAHAQSTKTQYAYSYNFSYPQYFTNGIAPGFIVSGIPVGMYTYSAFDACGDTINGAFEVMPDSISKLNFTFTYIKGCVDGNSLVCRFSNPSAANYASSAINFSVTNTNSGVQVYENFGYTLNWDDTIQNLPAGTYVLVANYMANNSLMSDENCSSVIDTLIIPPYQNPALSVLFTEACGVISYIVALADSNTGVYPFMYQVTSGPQVYPVQSDNKFMVSQIGTYTVRITDACGNSSSKQFSIDSLPAGPYFLYTITDSCFSAVINGHSYNHNAVIADTILNYLGCDSLIETDSLFILGTADSLSLFAKADTFCGGHVGVIVPEQNYQHYLWGDGSTDSTKIVFSPGQYLLTVTDIQGCVVSGSINVAFIDSPFLVSGWPTQIAVCPYQPVFLDLVANTTWAKYAWNTTDGYQNSLSRPIGDTGIYVFSIYNQCGISEYLLDVTGKDCNMNFYIPNAFTPNGDGQNDVFRVYFSSPVRYFSMQVFDRWGEMVFETNNENTGWNGLYKGVTQPMEVYVYSVDMVSLTGDVRNAKGAVTLIR